MCSIKNLVAFVTGGSSGLGMGLVRRLLEQGVKGCYIYDMQAPLFQNTYGDRLINKRGCVTDEDKVKNSLEECKEKFGRLDAVVNCAGVGIAFKIFNFNLLKAHDIQDIKKLFDINVVGTFNVNRLAVGYIDENEPDLNGLKGIVINTSCIASTYPRIGQSAYAASCQAIESMTLPMARDFGPNGIRCVTISVGYFDTPVFGSSPLEMKDYLGSSTICPKRMGKPEDFAHLVQSIIENPYINATTVSLDGGMRLHH